MTIDEILALENIGQKVALLKQGRRTPEVNASRLRNDWDPQKHEIIIDTQKYPKIRITLEKERQVFDESTHKTHTIPAKTKEVEPNRIAIPLEQDIVNIHTAFTVGTEPELKCDPSPEEEGIVKALKSVFRKNKLKYQNREIVRAWLSEQEVAEYWYIVPDDGFWAKLKARISSIFGMTKPDGKFKSMVWSPFRGDKLYPYFNDEGDLVAFSREYKRHNADHTTTTCFMCITRTEVHNWELDADWTEKNSFKHKFEKIPVIYAYREEALCDKIHTIRVRLEKLLSGYADCIDYHFFPILMLFGDVLNFSGEFKNRVVELTGNGANAAYLTWNQASDPVKIELDTYFNQAYALTNTPRISFDQLKGSGNALSGVSFRYVFMGAHMAVENHAETLGPFFQRRVNFLLSGLGTINSALSKPAETVDVDVEIVPYMIDSIDDKVRTAVAAVEGGVWSRRDGVMFAGNMINIEQTLKDIKEEMKANGSDGSSKGDS